MIEATVISLVVRAVEGHYYHFADFSSIVSCQMLSFCKNMLPAYQMCTIYDHKKLMPQPLHPVRNNTGDTRVACQHSNNFIVAISLEAEYISKYAN